ncbi:hypothetical protein DKX38_005793 [Salix brachista]|uniref:Uncharacterized protein n=1 Tax=Salix brachista TaxID=2182728 RepID=A0A5N5N3N5_9ROSI|nr:hypothetical protein DKX38_005793 [Salix brachista]
MGLLSNKIERDVLKPGDHIYSWRNAYLYAHHGLSLSLSLFVFLPFRVTPFGAFELVGSDYSFELTRH